MDLLLDEPRAPHLCTCVWHHSGTYFHGYSDPGWPLKACLLQTSLCALITALCVSFPAERREERRAVEGWACWSEEALTALVMQCKVEQEKANKSLGMGTAIEHIIGDIQRNNEDTDWRWEMMTFFCCCDTDSWDGSSLRTLQASYPFLIIKLIFIAFPLKGY